jgi:NhaA family Na+:H+ antiporter
MTVFFLVVGLEVKRELVRGELRDRRRAVLPVVAALGGMVVPALVYLALNPSGPAGGGWGIPMATDIAFAVGALGLLAPGIPTGARLFLLTLAVVDDIGAVVVIALAYSGDVEPAWLAAAGAALAVMGALRAARVEAVTPYVVAGVGLWLALHHAGVHPTLAGVGTAMLLPASARVEAIEARLHTWSGLVVVPVFALANAGVPLGEGALGRALTSRLTAGVVAGLVLGKLAGITGGAWLAVRSGRADLPDGTTWRHVAGVAALGGMGFTVSLFVAALAFADPARIGEAKVGILLATVLAPVVAAPLLRDRRGRLRVR